MNRIFVPSLLAASIMLAACQTSQGDTAPKDPLAAADARVESQEKNVARLVRTLEREREDVQDARKRVRRAESDLEKAERNQRKAEAELADARRKLSRARRNALAVDQSRAADPLNDNSTR